MGSAASEQSLSYLLDSYRSTGQAEGMRLLQQKATGGCFALREQCFASRAEYDKQFKRLAKCPGQAESENVLQLVKMWSQEHTGLCSSLYRIYTLYEYPRVRLSDEIEARQREEKPFEEVELFSIAQSCLNALHILQCQVYCYLSPWAIFILPQGVLKLAHPDLLDPLSSQAYNPRCYYAPQKMACFQRESEGVEQFQQQTVFSLGMTLLHSALLKSPAHCYQVSHKRFNEAKLTALLAELGQLYSNSLCKLITSMLAVDPWKRISLNQTQQTVSYFLGNCSSGTASKASLFQSNSNCDQMTGQSVLPRPHDFSLVYSGDTFHRASEAPLPRISQLPRQSESELHLDFSKQSMDLPKSPTLLLRSKKTKKTQEDKENLYSGKENHYRDKENNYTERDIYTDPKLIEMIRSGIDKISKSQPGPLALSTRDFNAGVQPQRCVLVVQDCEDGSHFEGMMRGGLKHGFGKIVYPDGVYYQGNFQSDQLQGKGSLFYGRDRPAYVGDWVQSKFHGQGTLYNEFPSPLLDSFDPKDFSRLGDCWVKYEGCFREDIKEGWGRILLTNGEVMQGNFLQGLLNGVGQFHGREQSLEGYWQNNKLIEH